MALLTVPPCALMPSCRIENLEQSNGGVYICRASSSYGQAQDAARLTIQGPASAPHEPRPLSSRGRFTAVARQYRCTSCFPSSKRHPFLFLFLVQPCRR